MDYRDRKWLIVHFGVTAAAFVILRAREQTEAHRGHREPRPPGPEWSARRPASAFVARKPATPAGRCTVRTR
ncbi:hypothetical protein GWI33_013636 [Rhynchophorus ferrugineus]|uniref:Uncharacterized protein n=1 Tax=Rhynchophorus ferrugineus TaxID=354439 RepID=A0A834MD32_RHYFE|nr:hypothetical protein GWI33_013636 [Rhynchophorus ferrugineus]